MIELFYYKISKNTEKEISENLNLLPEEEQNQLEKYKFKKDYLLNASARIFLRKTIARKIGLDLAKIEFKENQYGKPFLKNPEIGNLKFNLSHSGRVVILGLSDKEIGVDVEKIKPIDLSLAYDCFHQKEVDYLFRSEENRLERFYQIWTLKESFIKATGEGLSCPLKGFYFNLEDEDNIELYLKNENNHNWSFRMYNLEKNYKASICSKYKNKAEFKKISEL